MQQCILPLISGKRETVVLPFGVTVVESLDVDYPVYVCCALFVSFREVVFIIDSIKVFLNVRPRNRRI